MKTTLIAAEECVIMLKRIHTILCVEATEALIFIITNSDRIGSGGNVNIIALGICIERKFLE